MGIRFEHQVDTLSSIGQIEVRAASKPCRAERTMAALGAAAAGHVEFVSSDPVVDIRDLDMESEKRVANSKSSKEEASVQAATVNQGELAFN